MRNPRASSIVTFVGLVFLASTFVFAFSGCPGGHGTPKGSGIICNDNADCPSGEFCLAGFDGMKRCTGEATPTPSPTASPTPTPEPNFDEDMGMDFSGPESSPTATPTPSSQCMTDSSCEADQACIDGKCVTVTCDIREQICGAGGSVQCISNCLCDDGFPIGNCSSVCFDTGSTPTQCSDAGLGCPGGETPSCPK